MNGNPVYPLMFTFRDTISGNGFMAGITLSGRLTAELEDGEWWMYGVRPSALSETGENPPVAFSKFRTRYEHVLFDLAEEAKDFESFRALVEAFYNEPNPEQETRWEEAFQLIRARGFEPEKPFSDLTKARPETRPTQISVERLDLANRRFMPSDNISDTYFIPAPEQMAA